MSGRVIRGLGGFWYVAVRVGAGGLTLGDLALYLGAIGQAGDRIRNLSQALQFMSLAAVNLASASHFFILFTPTHKGQIQQLANAEA